MKQLKKLICFVLTIALMISSMTFTNAASQEAKNLNELGLLLNVTDQELNQELNRVIGITMVLKALGYKDIDTKSKVANNPFSDMEKHSWAKGFVAIAYENGITAGVVNTPTDKKFGPKYPLSKKELTTFMLRVLGYDSVEAWENTTNLAKKAGILTENSVEDNNFTKDDAAKIMYAALSAKLVNEEGRLIDRLVAKGNVAKENAIKVGLMQPELPAVFDVTSVSADNLRQIKVVFNREVNVNSAKMLSNYRLNSQRGVASRIISDAYVESDNKTVLLTVGPSLSSNPNPAVLENLKEYTLVIQNVKDASDQRIDKVEETFEAKDADFPEIKGIEFTGPRSAQITFSEPIKNVGTVKISQGNFTISSKQPEIDASRSNVVNVEVYNSFRSGLSYKFEVSEMKDFAGYPNIIIKGPEEKVYEPQTGLPTAKVVSADQSKVEIEFDRPVKGVSANHFYHSFAHQKAKEVYKDAALRDRVGSSDYVSKVWVVFATGLGTSDYPLPPQTELYVLGKVNAMQIMDNWGNKLADQKFKVNVVADNTAPAIESVDVQSDSRIVVTYSKDLYAAGSYKIVDSNGKTLVVPSTSLNGNKVTLNFSKINPTSAILEVRGVKDNTLSRNEMPVENRPIEFVDKTFDGASSVEVNYTMASDGTTVESAKLFVNYPEAVADNALDNRNYRLQTSSEEGMEGQDFAFGVDNRTVVITLDKAMSTKLYNYDKLNTAYLLIAKVSDKAGNYTASFQTQKAIGGLTAAQVKEAVLLKDGDRSKIEVKFDRTLETIQKNPSDFTIFSTTKGFDGTKEAGTSIAVTDVYQKDRAEDTIVLYLDKTLYTTQGVTVTIPDNAVIDSRGKAVPSTPISGAQLKDKVLPAVQTNSEGKELAKAYKDGSKYYVEITYTEPINSNSLSSLTYKITSGTDILEVKDRPTVVSNYMVKIEVAAPTNFDNDVTVSQDGGAISDINNNELSRNSNSISVVKEATWK